MRVEEIPEDMMPIAQEYRQKLLEAVSDFDDDIMMAYLEGEEIPVDKIRAAIRRATVAVKMVPVTCGTSYRNKGVQKLLDAIVDYMPSPLDVPPIVGTNPDTGEEDSRPSDDSAPFAALAFKIMTDPYVGRLSFSRRVFRNSDSWFYRPELHKRTARENGTYPSNACQSP